MFSFEFSKGNFRFFSSESIFAIEATAELLVIWEVPLLQVVSNVQLAPSVRIQRHRNAIYFLERRIVHQRGFFGHSENCDKILDTHCIVQ